MPTLGAPLDFAKLEAKQMAIHNLTSQPTSPVKGQLWFNSTGGVNELYYWDGTIWQSAKSGAGSSGPPSGPAGGNLAGTYPNPTIGLLQIDDTHVKAANKDGTAGTPSLRTLGTGAQQAMAGNTVVTPADATTGAKGIVQLAGDLAGTAASPQIAAGVITDAEVATANKDGVVGTASMRTIGTGAQQAMAGNTRADTIALPTASVNQNNQKIINLTDPSNDQDAANKRYVDNAAQGLDAKKSVRVATTGNITMSGTPQTVDGVSAVTGDRVLVKNQSNAAQNGIYDVKAGAWTRSADLDSAEEFPSAYVWVDEGTTQADTGWVQTVDTVNIDVSAVTWVQFASAGTQIAGAGLTKTGNTLDVIAGAGITVNADSVQVANDGITNAMMADSSVNLASADVFNTLGVSKGGTGSSNQATARSNLSAGGYYSSATHGAGTTISITAGTHALRATRGLIVQVQEEATGAVVLPDIVVAANGDVTVTFAASQSANTMRVTVIG